MESAEGCMVVEDLRKIHLVTDQTRRAILERLVNGPMTSRALAKELGISQQLAYHHLQKLIHASLVEVRSIERRGNKEVYFYHAVAPAFKFEVPEIRAGRPPSPYEPRAHTVKAAIEVAPNGNGHGHALADSYAFSAHPAFRAPL